MAQLALLVGHYLPGQPVTDQTMGKAMWLEKRQFENMANAVATGITRAL